MAFSIDSLPLRVVLRVKMFGTENLLLFVVSGLILNITPGADVLYILGRSSSQGFRGGSIAALGIGAGCIVHVISAAVGLSAIIATSATGFYRCQICRSSISRIYRHNNVSKEQHRCK